jgi:hypothetical protein
MEELNPHKPPTKADYRRYNSMLKELRADIAIVDHALQRIGRNLTSIRDKRLYFCGGYTSMKEFSEKELGQSKQQTYRLIAAYDLMQNLLMAGVAQEDLPLKERLCREVGFLKPEAQAKAWKAVLRISKEQNRPPTIVDVQAVVKKEEKPSERVQRQQTELLRKFESASASLKVSLDFALLDPAFRRRLAAVMAEIAETVTLMLRTLNNPAVVSRADADLKMVIPSKEKLALNAALRGLWNKWRRSILDPRKEFIQMAKDFGRIGQMASLETIEFVWARLERSLPEG